MFFIVPLITFRVICDIYKERFPFGRTSCVSHNRFGHLEIPRTIKPSKEFIWKKMRNNNISQINLIDPKRIPKVSH